MFKNIYVDLCDTLIKGNTTFIFLDSFFSHNKNTRYWHYRKISSLFIVRAIFKLLFAAKVDLNRKIAVRFLNGYDAHLLKEHVNWMLLNNLFIENQELAAALRYAKSQNISVTIVSASLDFIVQTIACQYSFDYYSSELKYENEICQGRLALDLLFEKEKMFFELEKDNRCYCFISDNVQDVEILKSCDYGYGVPTLKNKASFLNNNIEIINYDKLINLIKSE